MSNKQIIQVNGAGLCIEEFGDRSDPVILLIMGGAASMDWWPDGFCELLAAVGQHVLHGTEDPFFPYGHGEALARAIPGARLVPLAGVGHAELPPATWNVVVPAIVEHTSEG